MKQDPAGACASAGFLPNWPPKINSAAGHSRRQLPDCPAPVRGFRGQAYSSLGRPIKGRSDLLHSGIRLEFSVSVRHYSCFQHFLRSLVSGSGELGQGTATGYQSQGLDEVDGTKHADPQHGGGSHHRLLWDCISVSHKG